MGIFDVVKRRKSNQIFFWQPKLPMMTIANRSTFRGRGASRIALTRGQAVFGENVEETMA